ncbi:MAG: hypothetical protein KBC34_11320 [Phenylobacterium sp.]|nr:hypothetical protein [Phenylobacterium sp.]
MRSIPGLERLAASTEDLERNRYYAEERDRRNMLGSAGSLDEFLVPLRSHAAQLTQKTNQLNLTTRRYGEAQLAALLGLEGAAGYVLRARDRFGDSGIVGVAITAERGDALEIDSLLLSCRVIGRRIEDAMLSVLAACARDAKLSRLCGWYLPTAQKKRAGRRALPHGRLRTHRGP